METVRCEWITYRQAGELVGLSRTTLLQLVSTGEVQAVKVGRALRIDSNSLEHYMRQHSVGER